MSVYCKELFADELIALERWRPADTQEYGYQYPLDESNIKNPDQAAFFTPDYYFQECQTQLWDGFDPPIAFGQHANAEISAQIAETGELLENIVGLQPLAASDDAATRNAMLLGKVRGLADSIPVPVDLKELKYKLQKDDNPLSVVLL